MTHRSTMARSCRTDGSRSATRTLLFVALAALSGCGPAPEVSLGKQSAVIEVTGVGEWPDTEPVIVEDLAIDEVTVATWGLKGAEVVYAPAKGSRREGALIPPMKSPVDLTIPRGTDSTFDTIRVVISTRGFVRFLGATDWRAKGELRAEFMERKLALEPELVEMFLPRTSSAGEISLYIEQQTHELTIHAIQLVRRPRAAKVPSPFEPPKFVAIGDRSRPTLGLVPGVRLEGRAIAGPRSRVLVHAALVEAPSPGEETSATVTIEAAGGAESSATVPLGPEWVSAEVEVPDGAQGQEFLVRIETSGDDPVVVSTPLHLGLDRRVERPRTVLLITSDTHRADFVGFSDRNRGTLTPTLDAMAARGTVFQDAVSSTTITNPSHASIFTGLPVRDTGVVGNVELLSDRADTIAEAFQEAGYRTVAAVSARHLTPWRSGLGQGFELVDAPSRRMTRDGGDTTRIAREVLEGVEADEDVFIWLHLFDVHAPYMPREGFTENYYTGDPFSEKLAQLDPRAQAKWNRKIRDAEYLVALYQGEVSYMDQLLADLFEQAPRLGEGLVAFTSDHGEAHGEIGLYWSHTGLYPNTLRVPLFIMGPGVPAGRSVTSPVHNAAIARTLHALALEGHRGEGPFGGRSLLDEDILSNTADEPRYVLGANALSAGAFAGDWYLLMHLKKKGWGNPPGQPEHSMELYNLSEDPDALVNVVAEHPEVTSKLRRGLVRWLTSADPSASLAGGAPKGAAATADVAALGYATGEASTIGGSLFDPDCECPRCTPFR